ncbi:TadE/TadG family type IV pilus assembly protein [Marinobacter lutaoensis]|nr:TadE/TadG family type IV pilus assembly protein [Marinobacter lutaoensis]
MDRSSRGVVSLEFVFILPLIVGLFYGGAVYGVLFLNKLEMQRAVDMASTSVFHLDRRKFSQFGDEVVDHSEDALQGLVAGLPDRIRKHLTEQACENVSTGGVTLVECRLRAVSEEPFLPQLNLGFLGRFPPQPQELSARAAVAF